MSDEIVPDSNPPALEDVSTADLVRSALDETRELVRVEVQIAKSELQQELQRSKHAAIAFGISSTAGVLVLCMALLALVLALGATPLVALIVAGALLVVGGAAGIAGRSLMPKSLLGQTKDRLKGDVRRLREHIA